MLTMATSAAQMLVDERQTDCANMHQVTCMMQAQTQGPLDRLSSQDAEKASRIGQQMERICAKSKRWFHAEYFYSFIDRPYFLQNELVDPLESLDLPLEYNRKEWQLIRTVFQTIGATLSEREITRRRVFSERFVEEETAQLNQYREIFRDVMKQYLRQHVSLDCTNSFL